MPERHENYVSSRINVLLVIAYVTVILCLVFTVWYVDQDNEYAKGIVTLILGRFLGYTDLVYNFEFGKTRGDQAKDKTIDKMVQNSTVDGTVLEVQKDDKVLIKTDT